MRWRDLLLVISALVGLSALGCGGPEPISFLVDVVTDLEPGAVFDRVDTELYIEGALVPETAQQHAVSPSEPFARGVRVAQFESQIPGTYRVEVALMLDGAEVARKTERYTARSSRGITVTFARPEMDAAVPDGGADVPDAGLFDSGPTDSGLFDSGLFDSGPTDSGLFDSGLMCCMGICTDPTTDLNNCGGCGITCAGAGATWTCTAGSCQIASCDPGVADCDREPANGCETSLSTLVSCGGCGIPCDLPHASGTCRTGTCEIGTCDGDFGNCDGLAANGCETALTATDNCGSCGAVCAAGQTCVAGACS